jgi:hypothetical protein
LSQKSEILLKESYEERAENLVILVPEFL